MREFLDLAQTEHEQKVIAHFKQQEEAKIEIDASKKHHLLGTIAVPGVYREQKDKRGVIPPISEELLKTNRIHMDWIHSNIGHKAQKVKLRSIESPSDPKELAKMAQGPFLPKYKLERTMARPLRPTLRVQTDFFSGKETNLDRKLHEQSLLGKLSLVSFQAAICF